MKRGAWTAVVMAAFVLLVPNLVFVAPAQAETVRDRSWYLESMKVREAHARTQGSGVTVAVVDTGVDASHPDLAGQVLAGTSIGVPGSDGRTDEEGHGTAMASLIAGRAVGGEGLLGVAPQAKILPVKIKQRSAGSFNSDLVYDGVIWAIDHGAKVVNMSLGGRATPDASWKRRLVDYAAQRDVVLIAAAGNVESGDDKVAEPAAIPGIVAVSGLRRDGQFWSGSAHGPEVVVAAPAEGVPAAVPSSVSASGYILADGTSGATALVSGMAALIRAAYPQATAADVINRVIRTAKDLGPAGRDEKYGYGAVDAATAVTADVPHAAQNPLLEPGAGSPPPGWTPTPSKGLADDEATARSVGMVLGLVLSGGCCCLFVLLIGVVLLVTQRSRRTAAVQPGTPPWPPAGPGYGPGAPYGQPGFPVYGLPPYGQPGPAGPPSNPIGGPVGPPRVPYPGPPFGPPYGTPPPGAPMPPAAPPASQPPKPPVDPAGPPPPPV